MDEKERKLLKEVENWQNKTFNHIQIEVYEKMAEGDLTEYIESYEVNPDDFLNDCQLENDYKKYLKKCGKKDTENNKKDFCENHHDYNDYYWDEGQRDNYPMWNTLFELKHCNNSHITETAKKTGCGIISRLEPFNDTIFMSGCGYSFYGSHWIPIYLDIFPDAAEEYKGIKYEHL